MYTQNRLFLLVATLLFSVATTFARPAWKGVLTVTQPDGSTVSLRLVGDEYLHYYTTSDGYALVRDAGGRYVYASLDAEGQLTPTTLVAHDEGMRSQQENEYLQLTGRIAPRMNAATTRMRQQNEEARSRALRARRDARYDYSQFKGLVILVEYNDCPFRYDDYNDIMQQMINQDDYTGTDRTNFQLPSMFGGGYHTCTGSMRDFFRDNSAGMFVPTFDIVGPVSINRSQYYSGVDSQSDPYGKTTRSMQLMIDACTAADAQVNFKDYDTNNDGMVDMIYFVFSGLPSYIQGNDERLLWPHQSDLSGRNVRKDGVKLGRYACSTELFGYAQYNWSILEGIGTMCHEFSHVLGLPDFYDTGNTDDRECITPGSWTVMASGSDYDFGRRPCGYSLFERYALGFATPQVVSEPTDVTLTDIAVSNEGLRINSAQKNEFFMLENRQNTKWDASLPGHGLLVFRVDSTNNYSWNWYNAVNDNPDHPLYELIRATGYRNNDTGYDPFPGTGKVRELDNETSPAHLRSWTGKNTPFGLSNIQEQDGVISFQVFDAFQLKSISIIEQAMLGVGTTLQLTPILKPSYAQVDIDWTSSDEHVASVSSDGIITGIGEGTAIITVSTGELSASCEVTVADLPIVADIAAFRQLEQDAGGLLQLHDAQVLYVNKQDIFLRDASGAILLNGTGLQVSQGDILNGSIYGQMGQRNQMPIFTAVDKMTLTTGVVSKPGTTPEPVELHITQLTSDHYSNMVNVTKVQLEKSSGVWAIHGDRRIRLFNTLGVKNIKVPTDLNKRYDVTAIFGTNVVNGEVVEELYLLKSPTATTFTALTDISVNETVRLPEGRQFPLTAVLTPATADVLLTWTSSNEQVATVDADGMLNTLSQGVAVITVTDLETGLQAQCELTVGDRRTTDDIAEFTAMTLGSEADLTLTDAQVLYVYKADAYLRDASGTLRLASTGLPLTAGNVLNGKLYGCYVVNNWVPEMRPIQGSTDGSRLTITDGQEPEPLVVELAEVTEQLLANLITVKAAQLESSQNGLTGVYIVTPDGKEIRIYNSFGLKLNMPKDYAGKYFEVTGVLITATVNGQTVLNLALTESPIENQELSGISSTATLPHPADIYTTTGLRVRSNATGTHNLPRGVYIIDGRKVVVQ